MWTNRWNVLIDWSGCWLGWKESKCPVVSKTRLWRAHYLWKHRQLYLSEMWDGGLLSLSWICTLVLVLPRQRRRVVSRMGSISGQAKGSAGVSSLSNANLEKRRLQSYDVHALPVWVLLDLRKLVECQSLCLLQPAVCRNFDNLGTLVAAHVGVCSHSVDRGGDIDTWLLRFRGRLHRVQCHCSRHASCYWQPGDVNVIKTSASITLICTKWCFPICRYL